MESIDEPPPYYKKMAKLGMPSYWFNKIYQRYVKVAIQCENIRDKLFYI